MSQHKITDAIETTDSKTKLWKNRFAAAKAAYDLGELKQCRRLLYSTLEQAHDLHDSTFATNACHTGLAAVYLAQGDLPAARTHVQKSISALGAQAQPALRELLAVALRFNAHVLLREGRAAAAETEFKKAVSILTQLGGDGAVQLAYTLSDLALLYVSQYRLSEAKTLIAASSTLMEGTAYAESATAVRNNLIYHVCETTDDQEALAVIGDGISQMQYHRYKGHPGIKSAMKWYIERLEEAGQVEQAREARERFKSHLQAPSR